MAKGGDKPKKETRKPKKEKTKNDPASTRVPRS
jgi:hypothetical protein